jgi:hypothetical protein
LEIKVSNSISGLGFGIWGLVRGWGCEFGVWGHLLDDEIDVVTRELRGDSIRVRDLILRSIDPSDTLQGLLGFIW